MSRNTAHICAQFTQVKWGGYCGPAGSWISSCKDSLFTSQSRYFDAIRHSMHLAPERARVASYRQLHLAGILIKFQFSGHW
jgi:hypothetical protein